MSDYMFADADNHYYEAEDAFTRHGDEAVKRYVRWVQEGKRKHIMFGDRRQAAILNPTFDPVAKAAVLHSRLMELESDRRPTLDARDPNFAKLLFGELEPISDAYRNRDVRLDKLDELNLEKCVLFPSLGYCVEGLVDDDVMVHKIFHAFNLWIEDDWGYHYKDRIHGAPYICMRDPELAADEVEFVVNKGARVIAMKPGITGGISPADPAYDRFWSIVNDAEVLCGYHNFAGRSEYDQSFEAMFMRKGHAYDADHYMNMRLTYTLDRGILDTVLSLVLGNVFGRFPKVRVAAIEIGTRWVDYALRTMDHSGGITERIVRAFGETLDDRPTDIFKNHVWVAPFPEEHPDQLAEQIGASQVLFGSDWPHPEATATGFEYMKSLKGFSEAEVKGVMHDNLAALLSPITK